LAGRGYVPALDGLRALAVIGVLVFHDDRLGGGFLGVDLFFAVSGLLITSLLIDEHDRSGTIDLIGFWGRRLRRLLPAALMLLVATVIVFRLFADTGEWIVARTDAPWAQFYVANWHLIASGNSYWDSFAAPSAFEHLWSLAIEEQFYLVWPVVVMVVLARWQLRDLTVVVAVGTILSIAAMVLIFDGGDPTRVYMGTDTRAFSLLVGALFALPAIRGQINRFVGNRARFATVIAVSLLGGIGVMWVVAKGSSDWLFRGGLPAHSAMSALLAAFVVSGLTHVSSVLSARPLVAIGRLSYSLYLWHWPVFVFVNPDRFALDGWLITVIRFAVSLVLSVASYRLVEKPVRFRAPWAHGSRGWATFAVSMLVAVIVWVAIPVPATTNAVNDAALTAVLASTPIPVTTPPISPVTSTIPASTTTTAPLPPATSSTSTSTTTTTTIAPSGPPVETLLWYGDSIANDTWPPLGAALTEAGVDARSAAFGGVGLVAREGFDDPFGVLTGHLDEVDPDLLVMQLSLWDGYESSENLALVTIPVRSDDQADPGEAVLVANAEQFAAEHRNLVVLLDQTEVFGDTFRLDIDGDGNPERKRDGVHLCPTGALAITFWLVKQLSVNYEGIAVPESSEWILGDWRNAERYDDPPGACAGL